MAESAVVDCLFCKIIGGSIPSQKLVETEHSFAFLDIGPLARGHALVIPKQHAVKMHELSDASLADLMPVAKTVVNALQQVDGLCTDYNILQNNGTAAHQEVMHVHFHIITKPNSAEGLGVKWPATEPNFETLGKLGDQVRAVLKDTKK
jgi:diadenosine tetraphosphate (Ap4A) HIT family hydrolase